MSHFDTETTEKAALSKRERERWLNASSQVGEFVNGVAGRSDLIAKIGAGLGHGAPACFIPTIAEVEVDASICLAGVDPAEVALADEKFRLGRSPFIGAITHEAAHARFSTWVPATLHKTYSDLSQRILDVFMTLEESRIEAQILGIDRKHRKYLRACAGEIVARDFHIADDPYGASVGAALLLGRVSAGVFDEADVADFRDLILTKIEPDVLDTLEKLWREFQTLSFIPSAGDPGTERGIEIAKEWLDALKMDHEDPEPNYAVVIVMPGSEGDGKGEGGKGSGSGESEGIGKELADGAREHAMGEYRDNMREKRRVAAEERREEAAKEAKRVKAAKAKAAEAFGAGSESESKDETPGHGLGYDSSSFLKESRSPLPEERAAAVQIARALEQAQYSDRAVTKVKAVVPPGRMRGRGAVQRAAEEARGAIARSEVWNAKRRAHTDEPPLTVGIMTDISGSMGGAAKPSAVMSWVMAEATRRIHGKVATVLFGVKIHGIVRAGQRQDKVRIYQPRDGHEAFQDAFEALDGELNLLNGSGARMLVILSDAHFVSPKHADYATKAMRWCRDRGVAVVWIDVSGGFFHNYGWGEVVTAEGSALDAAKNIGRIAVEAVKKANARMQASA